MADETDLSSFIAGLPEVDITQPQEVAADSGLSDEALKNIGHGIELREKYGDSPATAAAVSALGAGSFGLTDRFIKEFIDEEAPQKLKEYNPGASLLGEVVGTVAPAIATGGTSVAAQGVKAAGAGALGAMKAGAAVERAVMQAIAESGSKSIAKKVIQRSLAKGAGGMTEGAILGAGQLAREDALGNVEFNAENLLAHAGTGALFGGLLTAAIPVAGVSVKGGSRLFHKAKNELLDPEIAALRLHGFKNEKDLLKLQAELGPDAGKKVLDIVRKDLGYTIGDDTAAHIAKLESKRKAIGEALEMKTQELDELVPAQQPGVIARQQLAFNKAADDIHNILINKPATAANAAERRALIDIGKNLRARAQTETALTSNQLWKLRQEYDKPLKSKYGHRLFDRDIDKANLIARSTIQDELLAFAKVADPALKDSLVENFAKYGIVKKLQKQISKAPPAPDFSVKATDLILGGIGYGLGDVPGLMIAGTKKLLDSNFKNKLVVLSGIEKANLNARSKLSKAAETFFTQSRRKASKLGAQKILLDSALSNYEGSKPKNKQEAFNNVRKNISELQGDGSKLLDRAVKAGSVVSQYAPQTATVLGNRLVSAVQFLDKKMPRPVRESNFQTGYEKPFVPSTIELAKFERYLHTIEAPLTVIEEVENGTITREHVEALQAVYPVLYSELRQVMYNRMRDVKEPMEYNKVVQLSILLDLPGDDSLIGKNIKALQENLKPGEEQAASGAPMVKSTQGGAAEIDMASREASDTQSFAARKGEF